MFPFQDLDPDPYQDQNQGQDLDQGKDSDQDQGKDSDQDPALDLALDLSRAFLIIYLLSKRKTLSSLQSKTHQSAILLTKD